MDVLLVDHLWQMPFPRQWEWKAAALLKKWHLLNAPATAKRQKTCTNMWDHIPANLLKTIQTMVQRVAPSDVQALAPAKQFATLVPSKLKMALP